MSTTWRWIVGILAALGILGLVFFGGSDRKNYLTARGVAQSSWQDVTWKWATLVDQAKGKTTIISNPDNYTILFKTDGTFEGKADCNQISGTYSQANGGFTIGVGPSTMAFCGEGSLDQQYLQLLGSVAAGGPDGKGGFALETAGGAQRMEFKH